MLMQALWVISIRLRPGCLWPRISPPMASPQMASGPGDAAFAIRDLGFWGPDFILFMGVNGLGRPIRLVQHYTQINVLLSAMPKAKPDEPARRIGFALQERVEKTQADKSPETSD